MIWGLFRRKPISRRGEDLAARYLRRVGYRILERNVRLGKFEIDIIAQEGDTIAFVEVKTRRDTTLAAPEENVTREKRLHIRKAAHRYIAARREAQPVFYRFDIVSVELPERGKCQITLFRDAFPDQ